MDVPEGAKRPQDHLPKKRKTAAVRREAEGDGTVDVEFGGQVYRLPADPQDWPVKAARAAENDRSAEASALIMESCAGVNVDDWTGRKLNELFEAYAEVAGFDQGE